MLQLSTAMNMGQFAQGIDIVVYMLGLSDSKGVFNAAYNRHNYTHAEIIAKNPTFYFNSNNVQRYFLPIAGYIKGYQHTDTANIRLVLDYTANYDQVSGGQSKNSMGSIGVRSRGEVHLPQA